jgi:acyl carrier protein
MAELEQEIKELIVNALMLDDVDADEIDSEETLFVKGLGLDSIDALELAIVIEKQFGVKIETSDEEKRKIFSCVRELASYVSSNRV